MKFSWKICFSTILISLIIFSIGGYVLISALFQSTYDREISNALEENKMMQYSFVAYWNTTVQELQVTKENVEKTAKAMTQNMKGSRMRISDNRKKVLFDNTGAAYDPELLNMVTVDSRGYLLQKTEEGYGLRTASIIQIEDQDLLYLETFRDVTAIFTERDNQYRIYRNWMIGVLALESLCCYVMAVWLLRPLKHLSGTTKKITEGNLSVRAVIKIWELFRAKQNMQK